MLYHAKVCEHEFTAELVEVHEDRRVELTEWLTCWKHDVLTA